MEPNFSRSSNQRRDIPGVVVNEGTFVDATEITGEATVYEIHPDGGIAKATGCPEGRDIKTLLGGDMVGNLQGVLDGDLPFSGRHQVGDPDGIAHSAEGAFQDPFFGMREEFFGVDAGKVAGGGDEGIKKLSLRRGEGKGIFLPGGIEALALGGEGTEWVHHGEKGSGLFPVTGVGEVTDPLARVVAKDRVDGGLEEIGSAVADLEVGGRGQNGGVTVGFEPFTNQGDVLKVFGVAGGVDQADGGKGAKTLKQGLSEVALKREIREAIGPVPGQYGGEADGFGKAAGDVIIEFGDDPLILFGEVKITAGDPGMFGALMEDRRMEGGGNGEVVEKVGIGAEDRFEGEDYLPDLLGCGDQALVLLRGKDQGLREDAGIAAMEDIPFVMFELDRPENLHDFIRLHGPGHGLHQRNPRRVEIKGERRIAAKPKRR